jgi:GGDEF domain-containing protein
VELANGLKRLGPLALVLAVASVVLGVTAVAIGNGVVGLLAGLCAPAVALAAAIGQPEPAAAPVRAAAPLVAVPDDPGVHLESGPTPITSVGTERFLDATTGLFDEMYFRVAVETRIAAARRHLRPVAVVLFRAVDSNNPGIEADPDAVTKIVRQTLRDSDTAARFPDGRYGFVLEDTPEDGAIWTVERLRRSLANVVPNQLRWAGIACYPAHAFNAAEVMAKAEEAYASAREWSQDRIEVAVAD